MNKVELIGNLTRDPELQTTNSGTSVCRFGLAVQRRFSNADGERGVDFLNITVWGKPAENCHKYLKKGSKCAICGRIQVTTYDAQDGSKRTSFDIVAEEVEFIGSRNNNDGDEGQGYGSSNNNYSEQKNASKSTELEPIEDDSLPF